MKKVIGFDEKFDLILNQLIHNKLSNSLLLTGNKGIGKKYFFHSLLMSILTKIFQVNKLIIIYLS